MKKAFILLILILLVMLSFAEQNEKVTIVFVSQPGVDLYINGNFALTIGPSGNASFSFSLGNTYDIYADSDYYIQIGQPLVSTSDGKTIVFLNMKPAAWLGVICNTYPVDIFVDGTYYGTIENEDDMIKIPAGIHDVVISSTGYKEEKINVTVSWKEKKYIKVTLKKSKPEFYIILPYSTFSPNGDWDKDKLKIKIYASEQATATILIEDQSGKIHFERQTPLNTGVNEFEWDGKNAPDGEYTLQVSAMGRIQERKIILTRKNYTYKKEITLASIALFSALIIAGFFFLK